MKTLIQNIQFIIKYIIFRKYNRLEDKHIEFLEKSGVKLSKFQWKLIYYAARKD